MLRNLTPRPTIATESTFMNRPEENLTLIRQWVTQTFPLAGQQEIGIHDSLLDSGIIDSMGTLEVVEYLESEFGIEVSDEEMIADHFDSIQSIAQFVESKQGPAAEAG